MQAVEEQTNKWLNPGTYGDVRKGIFWGIRRTVTNWKEGEGGVCAEGGRRQRQRQRRSTTTTSADIRAALHCGVRV